MFVDSADKGTRFIALCDAFNIPLLFLADVPGFMIGSKVERQGIIRHGAKMIYAVSEATVPKISVIVRKVYGAGLYAMCGPAYGTDATLALPTANIAVMGPEAAVNAVYYNKIMELPGRGARALHPGPPRRVSSGHRPLQTRVTPDCRCHHPPIPVARGTHKPLCGICVKASDHPTETPRCNARLVGFLLQIRERAWGGQRSNAQDCF